MLMNFLFLTISFNLYGHAGHEHGPEVKLPPNGGVIEESKNYHVELVHQGKQIMIYFYDIEMSPIEKADTLFVKAYTKLPRKERKELEFKAMGNHMHAQFDPQGAHRFDVYVEVKDEGKSELKWTLH